MKYSIFRLHFSTGVHIGRGKLTDGEMTLCADTLFSALCQEALKLGGNEMLQTLIDMVNDDEVLISDCMPFINSNNYYMPKPMLAIDPTKRDENAYKIHKKLKYISADNFRKYVEGTLDESEELASFSQGAGSYAVTAKVAVRTGGDTLPYHVGSWHFPEDSGLYFVLGYENDEQKFLICDLVDSLSYTGIGGKKSSGMGKFTCVMTDKIPDDLQDMLTKDSKTYMTISTCLPADEELDRAITDAKYLMEKRSGFIDSQTYSNTFLKKRTVFMFKSGSCFDTRFRGELLDVSEGGNHPVYRYAKAMLVGVK